MTNNTLKVTYFIILFALITSFVTYRLYTELCTEPQLRKNLLAKGRYSIAIIEKVNLLRRSSHSIPTYTFKVNNEIITSTNSGIIQKTLFPFSKESIGSRRYVIFIPDKPSDNSILPLCVPPDSLQAPNEGWSTLPTGKIEFIIP